LFVAIDPPGLVPLFLGVTQNLDEPRRRRLSIEAVAAALSICLLFMFTGNAIFDFLDVTAADFRIGGGIILLVLAVLDLLIVGKPAVNEREMTGVVPLGMPLIAGPATLTTVLVLASREPGGYAWTSLSLGVNMAILLAALLAASPLARLVGENTLRAISKLVMVLLAAIAVNFIRTGITQIISDMR
jgi:multiple antibiotic resistance protein